MNEPLETTAAPAGEEIHMPASSILPLVNATALALMIVGITFSWWLVGAAGVVFVATTIKWIASTVHDVNALPWEHHH